MFSKLLPFFVVLSLLFAQDLWDDGKGEIFSDQKVLPNGTIIRIKFEDSLVTSYKAKLNRVSQKNKANPRINSEFLKFLPDIAINRAASETDETTLSSEESLKGVISGTIESYNNDNKTYTISASHVMEINGKNDSITIAGRAATKKISADGSLLSSDLADVRIVYSGVLVSGRTSRVSEADFNNLDFISTATNAASLSPDRQKALFIDFFNVILQELF